MIQELDGALVYQYDVIIFVPLEKNLKSVLNRRIHRYVTMKANNSKFGVSELELLRFKINAARYWLELVRLKLVVRMERPRGRAHLCSFMGCLHYYWRFTPGDRCIWGGNCSSDGTRRKSSYLHLLSTQCNRESIFTVEEGSFCFILGHA